MDSDSELEDVPAAPVDDDIQPPSSPEIPFNQPALPGVLDPSVSIPGVSIEPTNTETTYGFNFAVRPPLYDGTTGQPVDVKDTMPEQRNHTTSNGKAKKPRKEPVYESISERRSKKRRNARRAYSVKAIDQKIITGDDIVFTIYPKTNRGKPTTYSTSLDLIKDLRDQGCSRDVTTPTTIDQATGVSPPITAPSTPQTTSSGPIRRAIPPIPAASPLSSPSERKKIKRGNPNACSICGILWDSAPDRKLKSIWVRCSTRSCNSYTHLCCIGFKIKRGGIESVNSTIEEFLEYGCRAHPFPLPKRNYGQ